MINSLLVGEVIHNILTNDAEVLKYVKSENIFPLVSDEGTSFPFIVFGRDGIQVNYQSKDGPLEDYVTIHFYICATEYSESCYIANAVRNALEMKHGRSEDINITQIHLENASEAAEYDDGWVVYEQEMIFSMKIS